MVGSLVNIAAQRHSGLDSMYWHPQQAVLDMESVSDRDLEVAVERQCCKGWQQLQSSENSELGKQSWGEHDLWVVVEG